MPDLKTPRAVVNMTYPSCPLSYRPILNLAVEENATIAELQLASILYVTAENTFISGEVSYVIVF
jgi:hypothetical protein